MSNGFISITHLPPTRRMPKGWRLHLSPQRPGYNLGCAGNMLTRSLLQSRNVFKNVLQKIPCSTTKAGLPSNMLTRSLLQSRNVFKNVLQKIPSSTTKAGLQPRVCLKLVNSKPSPIKECLQKCITKDTCSNSHFLQSFHTWLQQSPSARPLEQTLASRML